MTTNYVLVDYENVNAGNLNLLAGGSHKLEVLIFLGPLQTKIPVDLAIQISGLRTASYVKVSGRGKNALDFHIAYYVGRLSERNPEAFFHVVSQDKGFDPLIEHLRGNGRKCYRVNDVSDLLPLRVPLSPDNQKRIDVVLADLSSRGASRPRRMKTLIGTIGSVFKGALDEATIRSLIESLRKKGHVVVDGDKVTYNLPARETG